MDIMDDSKAYRRISAAARHDLYLNWDDVVRDVYEDYNTFIEAERQSIQTATSRLINIYHNASEPRN
jgi:hypothetical protein